MTGRSRPSRSSSSTCERAANQAVRSRYETCSKPAPRSALKYVSGDAETEAEALQFLVVQQRRRRRFVAAAHPVAGREDAGGRQHAKQFVGEGVLVGDVHDRVFAEHDVEAAVGKRQRAGSICTNEVRSASPAAYEFSIALTTTPVSTSTPMISTGSNSRGDEQRAAAGAAAEIEHTFAAQVEAVEDESCFVVAARR